MIVLLEAVESSVAVLLKAKSNADMSFLPLSDSGKLLDTAIGSRALLLGVEGVATEAVDASISCRSMRRSTSNDALRIETERSSGRMNREVNNRSEGPMEYVGVERL